MGMGGKRHAPTTLLPDDPVSIVKEAGWAPGPVWKDAENLASNRGKFQKRNGRFHLWSITGYVFPCSTYLRISLFSQDEGKYFPILEIC